MTAATRTPDPREGMAFVLWSGSIGGAETFVVALASALRASGLDAQVVVLTHAQPLAERLQQAGVPFSELGLARPVNVLKRPSWLAKTMSRAGPEGVVLPGCGFLAPALRLGGYSGRIVAVEHGSLLQDRRTRRRTWVVDRFDRLLGTTAVDVHVAVSDFLRSQAAVYMRGGAIVTIPNGVDIRLYRPPSSPRSRGAFVIGCLARLIRGKGVEDVLVAAKPALERGAQLRIGGDGPERPMLEQLAERLRVRDRVSFDGLIGEAAGVAAFWHGCDVAIAAPNEWVEAFGLSAVEAMACGVPVVATRTGGLAEVVAHARTGVLTEPGDTHALAAALLAYMEDESLLAVHGAAARLRCEQRFDIRRSAAGYAGLFRPRSLGTSRAVDSRRRPARAREMVERGRT